MKPVNDVLEGWWISCWDFESMQVKQKWMGDSWGSYPAGRRTTYWPKGSMSLCRVQSYATRDDVPFRLTVGQYSATGRFMHPVYIYKAEIVEESFFLWFKSSVTDELW